MMACMIQALPYDLPAFVPPLLTSFVRHVTLPSLKDIGALTELALLPFPPLPTSPFTVRDQS